MNFVELLKYLVFRKEKFQYLYPIKLVGFFVEGGQSPDAVVLYSVRGQSPDGVKRKRLMS
jgi:hypothetical protein